jgi:hypothetical protein
MTTRNAGQTFPQSKLKRNMKATRERINPPVSELAASGLNAPLCLKEDQALENAAIAGMKIKRAHQFPTFIPQALSRRKMTPMTIRIKAPVKDPVCFRESFFPPPGTLGGMTSPVSSSIFFSILPPLAILYFKYIFGGYRRRGIGHYFAWDENYFCLTVFFPRIFWLKLKVIVSIIEGVLLKVLPRFLHKATAMATIWWRIFSLRFLKWPNFPKIEKIYN